MTAGALGESAESVRSSLTIDFAAEFSFQTNAPPSGGHVESDHSAISAGIDTVLLHSVGWTDDVDDLPLTHSFGYVQGYHEVIDIAR